MSEPSNRSRALVAACFRAACAACLAAPVGGCAASRPAADRGASPAVVSGAASRACDDARLVRLRESRRREILDFRLGPGDLLQVSAADVKELEGRTVRVGGDGNVSLPLVGLMRVAGLTQEEVRREIGRRLEEFLYHPQVEIFVKSYSSRQVAVMGAVHSPGMYLLNGPDDTLRNVLERAGGTTENAAGQIVFTPVGPDGLPVEGPHASPVAASPSKRDDGRQAELSLRPAGTMPGLSPGLQAAAPLVIDLGRGRGEEGCLELPMRPGDTIYVPRAGKARVIGWVYSPTTIQITPGLTVLGAVSAAGGPLFAADASSVKVIRQGSDGEAKIIRVNLNKVKELRETDVPVRDNDVIEVPYSLARLPGYAVYYAALGIVSFVPAEMVLFGVP